MSLINPDLLQADTAFYSFPVRYSLVLDGTSNSLSRTPASAGSRRQWTFACWIKKTAPGSVDDQVLISSANSPIETIEFNTSDQLRVYMNGAERRLTARKFRDYGAWYHIIVAVDTENATADNRIRVWVNFVEVTDWVTKTNPTQNYDTSITNASLTYIGRYTTATDNSFRGYLAQVALIDGQQITDPTTFGQFKNGIAAPGNISGLTFGTTGFLLEFADSGDLGNDVSGNGNDWTENSITSANQSIDTPTNNFPTLDPLNNWAGNTLSEGNLLTENNTDSTYRGAFATMMLPSTGKWYFEATLINADGQFTLGVEPLVGQPASYPGSPPAGTTSEGATLINNGGSTRSTRYNNVTSNSRSADSAGDKFLLAWHADTRKLWLARHTGGSTTWFGSGSPNPSTGTDPTYTLPDLGYDWGYYVSTGTNNNGALRVNFGANGFDLTLPTDFQALCCANLLEPPADSFPYTQCMDTVLYTGDGNGRNILTNDQLFTPRLALWKQRSSTERWKLHDAVRGAGASLSLDGTDVELSENGPTDFISGGVTLSGMTDVTYNTASSTYAVWLWALGTAFSGTTTGLGTGQAYNGEYSIANGMAVITYTGNGTAGHTLPLPSAMTSLYGAPKMMIIKRRDAGGHNWAVWHPGITSAAYAVYLDASNAQAAASGNLNSTAPSSSVVTLGSATLTNGSGAAYLMIVFWEVPGFSKALVYEGNASADGTFVHCGFRPGWVLLKNVDAAGSWPVMDKLRQGHNEENDYVVTDTTAAESGTTLADLLSNGIKMRTTSAICNSAATFIGWAFAEQPLKYANAR